MIGRITPLLLGLSILALDQATKWFVATGLPLVSGGYPYGGIGLFDKFLGVQFSIVHATNLGAAWSLFSEYSAWLVGLRLLFVIPLLAWTLFINNEEERSFPLSLVLAGAIGNILDSFVFGHVIDMFFFIFWGYPYPVFNIADVSIFIGVSWLILQSVKKKRRAAA